MNDHDNFENFNLKVRSLEKSEGHTGPMEHFSPNQNVQIHQFKSYRTSCALFLIVVTVVVTIYLYVMPHPGDNPGILMSSYGEIHLHWTKSCCILNLQTYKHTGSLQYSLLHIVDGID